MKWRLSLLLIFGFSLLAGTIDAADKNQACYIELKGEIDKDTPSRLASLYAALNNGNPDKCSPVFLLLDSTGGNVEFAMNAGEFVRKKKMWTSVPVNSYCASACVFVLLGGVYRITPGNIGLHRPFTDELSPSETVAKARYEKINRLIKQYLNRMNIPEALLDAMNAVPPGEIKWLNGYSDDERLKELHIWGEDVVYADEKDSAHAKRIGISKKEYYLRQQRARAVCGYDSLTDEKAVLFRYFECYKDVINGKR